MGMVDRSTKMVAISREHSEKIKDMVRAENRQKMAVLSSKAIGNMVISLQKHQMQIQICLHTNFNE